MKKIITIIIVVAFALNSAGQACPYALFSKKTVGGYALRPMASGAHEMAQARKNGLRMAVGLPVEEGEKASILFPKTSSAGNAIDRHRKAREGRQLAKAYQQRFADILTGIIREMGHEDEVTVFTYGSAGGQFMVAGSDTDIVIIPGKDTNIDIDTIEAEITGKLKVLLPNIGKINFHSWQDRYVRRIQKGPYYGRFKNELRSAKFICGNKDLFDMSIAGNETVLSILSDRRALIASVLRASLYAQWRSSRCELGDVKDYYGGSRDVQAIYRTVLAVTADRKKVFVSQINSDALIREGIIDKEQKERLDNALDFLLVTKHIVSATGDNNILSSRNLRALSDEWAVEPAAIKREYQDHVVNVLQILEMAKKYVLNKVQYTGTEEEQRQVAARFSNRTTELRRLIDSEDIAACTTMALRVDLPEGIRDDLRQKLEKIYGQRGMAVDPELLEFTDWAEAQSKTSSAGESQSTSGKTHYEDFTDIPWYQDGLQQLLKTAPVKPNSLVLDLGCGTGALTKLIATDISPNGRIFGIDISNDRAQIASEYFSEHENVSIITQDVTELNEFEAGSIHNIFIANAIHLIDNKTRFLESVSRILADGGSFAFSTSYFIGSQSVEAQTAMKKLYVRSLRKLKERGVTISDKRTKACKILSKDDYVKLVEDNGLAVVVQKEITYDIKPGDFSSFFSDPEVSENMFPSVPYEIRTEVLMESLAEISASLRKKGSSSNGFSRNWLIISARKPSMGSIIQGKPKSLIASQGENQTVLTALATAA